MRVGDGGWVTGCCIYPLTETPSAILTGLCYYSLRRITSIHSPTHAGLTAITDSNIGRGSLYGSSIAVDAWISNPTAAAATYGHIKFWDTGDVTDMLYLFAGKASFNDAVGHW